MVTTFALEDVRLVMEAWTDVEREARDADCELNSAAWFAICALTAALCSATLADWDATAVDTWLTLMLTAGISTVANLRTPASV